MSRLPYLREVIVGVDYDAIGYNFAVFNQDWQDRQYYPYTGQLYHDGTLQRLLAQSAFFRSNRDLSVLFSGARSAPRVPNPILPIGNGEASTPEGCRKRAKEPSEVKFRDSLIEENSGYLREMTLLGERYGVSILFLNAPKSACYREAYSRRTMATGRAAILKALGPQAGQFQDYLNDSRFSKDDFLDDDHLNQASARKLMDDLALISSEGSSRLEKGRGAVGKLYSPLHRLSVTRSLVPPYQSIRRAPREPMGRTVTWT